MYNKYNLLVVKRGKKENEMWSNCLHVCEVLSRNLSVFILQNEILGTSEHVYRFSCMSIGVNSVKRDDNEENVIAEDQKRQRQKLTDFNLDL